MKAQEKLLIKRIKDAEQKIIDVEKDNLKAKLKIDKLARKKANLTFFKERVTEQT
jgi:hypothetical protein